MICGVRMDSFPKRIASSVSSKRTGFGCGFAKPRLREMVKYLSGFFFM
jgi:hypothetical protein